MIEFQGKINDWMLACFGKEIAGDVEERNWRFLEESLELVQSLGCTKEQALQMVEYVFSRPVGEPKQEVGGVMVTLAALCNAHDIIISFAYQEETRRIWTKIPEIRAKQASKQLRNKNKEALP